MFSDQLFFCDYGFHSLREAMLTATINKIAQHLKPG